MWQTMGGGGGGGGAKASIDQLESTKWHSTPHQMK